jgi:hypothetical protein
MIAFQITVNLGIPHFKGVPFPVKEDKLTHPANIGTGRGIVKTTCTKRVESPLQQLLVTVAGSGRSGHTCSVS